MKNQLSFVFTAVALLAGSLSGAIAPEGGMTVAVDSACSFQALSWSMGANQTGGPVSVTVSATKHVDSCSQTLYSRLTAGTRIRDVTFTAVGATQPALTLNNVIISGDDITGTSSAGLATEALTFSFQSFASKETGPSSAGATNISVNIPGLCSFSATAWSISASAPAMTTSTGISAGKATTSNLSITKPLDSCSQSLVQALTTATTEASLTLVQVDPDSGSTITVTLGSVQIASYTVGDSSPKAQSTETIGVKYSNISITSK